MAFELASDMPPRGNLHGVIAQPVSLPRHGTKYNTQPDLTGIFTMANVLVPPYSRAIFPNQIAAGSCNWTGCFNYLHINYPHVPSVHSAQSG